MEKKYIYIGIIVVLLIFLIIDWSVYTVDECFANFGELISDGCGDGKKELGKVSYEGKGYFCCRPK